MFRRLILSAVVAAGVVGGLAMTPSTVEAIPPIYGPYPHHEHHRDRFEVVYRHGRHMDVYGTYRDRDDAERAARRLRHMGYFAEIRRA